MKFNVKNFMSHGKTFLNQMFSAIIPMFLFMIAYKKA